MHSCSCGTQIYFIGGIRWQQRATIQWHCFCCDKSECVAVGAVRITHTLVLLGPNRCLLPLPPAFWSFTFCLSVFIDHDSALIVFSCFLLIRYPSQNNYGSTLATADPNPGFSITFSISRGSLYVITTESISTYINTITLIASLAGSVISALAIVFKQLEKKFSDKVDAAVHLILY